MITPQNLMRDLENAGLRHTDTVLIHSSMKSIGPVPGGADTVLEVLEAYFADGLLVFPTLTWKIGYDQTPEAGVAFSVRDSETDVGILASLFRKRPGVLRSLHPTHSVAAKGADAAAFIRNHQKVHTTLAWNSPWGRLYERHAKILFIGTGIGCNTFLHAVEEKAALPGLLSPEIKHLSVTDEMGRTFPVDLRRHVGEHSHQYHLIEPLLLAEDACRIVRFGEARCHLLDACRTADLVWELLRRNPSCFAAPDPPQNIPPAAAERQ